MIGCSIWYWVFYADGQEAVRLWEVVVLLVMVD